MNAKLISIATTLVLASGAALANAPMSVASPLLPSYVDGSAHEAALANYKGQLTREQVRAELMAAKRLPTYVEGSQYENALAMFMSFLSREQVRADARNIDRRSASADFAAQHGGRN